MRGGSFPRRPALATRPLNFCFLLLFVWMEGRGKKASVPDRHPPKRGRRACVLGSIGEDETHVWRSDETQLLSRCVDVRPGAVTLPSTSAPPVEESRFGPLSSFLVCFVFLCMCLSHPSSRVGVDERFALIEDQNRRPRPAQPSGNVPSWTVLFFPRLRGGGGGGGTDFLASLLSLISVLD